MRASLINDPRVRKAWIVADAINDTASQEVPFMTSALLSKSRFSLPTSKPQEEIVENDRRAADGEDGKFVVSRTFRVPLPSKFNRDALCIEVKSPAVDGSGEHEVVRLINVHLDSLEDTDRFRVRQLEQVASLLREPDCRTGLIAGDFNATRPLDHELLSQNNLIDAWVALDDGRKEDAATWGFGKPRKDGLGPARLDKVAMVGLMPKHIELLHPGYIEIPKPMGECVKIPWSDHRGLRCIFGT
jgi:tyrosyl-DNA phosphodiesterase 2